MAVHGLWVADPGLPFFLWLSFLASFLSLSLSSSFLLSSLASPCFVLLLPLFLLCCAALLFCWLVAPLASCLSLSARDRSRVALSLVGPVTQLG